MKKFFLPVIVLLICFNFLYSEPVQEQPAPNPMIGGNPPGHEAEPNPDNTHFLRTEKIFEAFDELNLSDEQIEKIRNLRKQNRNKIEQLRHEIKMALWDIQDEYTKSNPDKGKIDAAIEKISGNQKTLLKLRVEQMLEIKKILTDEQFKKLLNLMETGLLKMKKNKPKLKKR